MIPPAPCWRLLLASRTDSARAPQRPIRLRNSTSGFGEFFEIAGDSFYTYSLPLHRDAEQSGALVVIYDTSYIEGRVSLSLRDLLLTAVLQTLLITSLASFWSDGISRRPWPPPRSGCTHSVPGPLKASSNLPHGELFDEIQTEAKHLAYALDTARAAAQEEAQLRETQSAVWTAERLRVSLANKLGEKPLFLVSNREPYMHVFQEKSDAIQTIVPASGLVTALEPVLQACHGTWIANGSGSADREVVDALDHLPGTSGSPYLHTPPRLAYGRRRPRLLRRFFQ